MWVVYLLRSHKKRWYYLGSTNDLTRRLEEHNAGKVLSTKAFRPLDLVYEEEYVLESEARARERFLKDKRIAKEALIRELEK